MLFRSPTTVTDSHHHGKHRASTLQLPMFRLVVMLIVSTILKHQSPYTTTPTKFSISRIRRRLSKMVSHRQRSSCLVRSPSGPTSKRCYIDHDNYYRIFVPVRPMHARGTTSGQTPGSSGSHKAKRTLFTPGKIRCYCKLKRFISLKWPSTMMRGQRTVFCKRESVKQLWGSDSIGTLGGSETHLTNRMNNKKLMRTNDMLESRFRLVQYRNVNSIAPDKSPRKYWSTLAVLAPA